MPSCELRLKMIACFSKYEEQVKLKVERRSCARNCLQQCSTFTFCRGRKLEVENCTKKKQVWRHILLHIRLHSVEPISDRKIVSKWKTKKNFEFLKLICSTFFNCHEAISPYCSICLDIRGVILWSRRSGSARKSPVHRQRPVLPEPEPGSGLRLVSSGMLEVSPLHWRGNLQLWMLNR